MTKTRNKKLTTIMLISLGIIMIPLLFIICIWGHEIRSLTTIKQLTPQDLSRNDGYTYEMKISGDYYFDEFLELGGASNDSELISFITGKITKGIIPMTIEETEISCSSFTATTTDGDRIFARNYDFDLTNTCIVYTDPGHGRHASVSTIDLQFIGIDNETGISGFMDKVLCLAAPYIPLDGINDAGVSCGIYMSYQGDETVATNQQTDKPDITSTTMLRLILDYADSVDEAIELVSKYDLHDSAGTSYHYMVADAEGNSAILEWVNGTDKTDNDGSARVLKVIRNTDETDIGSEAYQCITNYIVSPNYYGVGDSMPGSDRYEHLKNRLSETDGIIENEEHAMALLGEVGRRNWLVDGDNTNGITVHSVIYNLTDRTSLWVGNEHFGEDAYTFIYKAG